jgi:cytochrome b pre-mRNA-processing protein 3
MMGFLRRDGVREAADVAYRRVVEQARQPVFFTEYGVPDTFDGRFELTCLFAFLYLRRLKAEREDARRLSQAFLDRMFADFDRALRELGTGDLRVGKEMKRMAEAFYGRIRAYEEGIGGGERLAAALERNLFGTLRKPPRAVDAFAYYVRRAASDLAREDRAELLSGRVRFRAPEGCGVDEAVR